MKSIPFPVIDPAATGQNIMRLRLERGLTVRDLQVFFGFEEPQAIYKWQSGKSLPTVDNLYALSVLLGVRMDEILVSVKPELKITASEPQAETCGSVIFIACSMFPVIELLVESLYCPISYQMGWSGSCSCMNRTILYHQYPECLGVFASFSFA
nr:helix-turn-helix transcriptional regulator [uncultured Oscillibacter sp.]